MEKAHQVSGLRNEREQKFCKLVSKAKKVTNI